MCQCYQLCLFEYNYKLVGTYLKLIGYWTLCQIDVLEVSA